MRILSVDIGGTNIKTLLSGETPEDKRKVASGHEFTPADMVREMEECKLLKNELVGNTLKFELSCNMQGTPTTAKGEFFTDGKTARSEMVFDMSAGQMPMTMTMKSEGKRLGDC